MHAHFLAQVWSDELAEVARNYSAKCMFTFNPDRVSQQDIFKTVGENLSFDFSDGTFDYVALINNSGVQGDDYNIEDNTCQGVCAFYTQVC